MLWPQVGAGRSSGQIYIPRLPRCACGPNPAEPQALVLLKAYLYRRAVQPHTRVEEERMGAEAPRIALLHPVAGKPASTIRGGSTGEVKNGCARIHHAPAPGSRRPFRSPDPPLE